MSGAKGQNRLKIKANPRAKAFGIGNHRRFQVDLELKGTLSGDQLRDELAKFGYEGNTVQAARALMTIEAFIQAKLAEGWQLDFELASFYPLLSGGLTARDVDPETDGLYVQGAVRARRRLGDALKDQVEAINPLARRTVRLFNVFDRATEKFDVIVSGHELSVSGRDIAIEPTREDEGFWLEKRSGRWNKAPKQIMKAKVLRSDLTAADIVFPEAPVPGKYNLVVCTRCGDGPDYKVRRIGHPVTVE